MPAPAAPSAEAIRPWSVLLDTNVVLDMILGREPWAAEAARLLDAIAAGQVGGHVASHTVTTVFYLVHRARGAARARSAVADLLSIVDVVALEQADFLRALAFELPDYEDAVQVAAGLRAGARFVVTRNPKDFMGAELPTRSAGEILALLAVAGP